LRDRKEDIEAISEALIADLNRKHETRVTGMDAPVLAALLRHEWPGNVRELRNVLERSVIVAGEGQIELRHLPAHLAAVPGC
jgi:transcriptional regulator with PAS, ATPase and Fis domain